MELALEVDLLDAGLDLLARPGRAAWRGAVGREVDAELLGGAQQLVVLLGDLEPGAVVAHRLHVERERLHLLQSTLNDSGMDGSGMFSPLTIAS